MRFLKLHDIAGQLVLFNPDHVVLISPGDGSDMDGGPVKVSVLALLNGGHAQVVESVGDIETMLEALTY